MTESTVIQESNPLSSDYEAEGGICSATDIASWATGSLLLLETVPLIFCHLI